MQEINRNILFSGIYDLPEHKTPPELWKNIEIMMLDVPASILPVHMPSSKSWSAIEVGLGSKAPLRKPAYIALVVLLLAILFGVTADRFINNGGFSGRDRIENSNIQEAVSAQKPLIVNDNITTAGDDMQSASHAIIPEPSHEDETILISDHSKQENINKNIRKDVSENSVGNDVLQETLSENPPLFFMKSLSIDRISTNMQNPESRIPPGLSENANPSEAVLKYDQFRDCNYRGTEHIFGLNPGVEYQYLLNSGIPENANNKYWYAFDLRLYYQVNRFSIETGLGIGFSKDNLNFSYNYLTNEIIDSYVYVDSAYYDPITGTTQYYTTIVDVYDSVPYSAKSFVEKKYTYLQLPLEFGYEIIKRKKFALSIKAGITYYKEIDRKEIYPVIYQENSRITSLGSNNCERREEFFSLLGGLEFRWNMSDKFQFNAEPSYRYFLNQIYLVDDNNKGPMSIGLRLGLRYKF